MSRSSQVYADFLLPHLTSRSHLVDVGCGSGELSLELAASVRQVTGVDVDVGEVEAAQRRADSLGIENADFRLGDAYALDLPSDQFDAVFAHSVLEDLNDPAAALAEMKRTLKPGGVVAVASVEYGGLILAGPEVALARRFYEIREQLWNIEGADPFLGRDLRGLLVGAGFVDVTATTTYISYGTTDTIREFGMGRADDCEDEWYVASAQRHELATPDDLAAMRRAWLAWSESSTSYAAFAWCRALGWKPEPGVALT